MGALARCCGNDDCRDKFESDLDKQCHIPFKGIFQPKTIFFPMKLKRIIF